MECESKREGSTREGHSISPVGLLHTRNAIGKQKQDGGGEDVDRARGSTNFIGRSLRFRERAKGSGGPTPPNHLEIRPRTGTTTTAARSRRELVSPVGFHCFLGALIPPPCVLSSKFYKPSVARVSAGHRCRRTNRAPHVDISVSIGAAKWQTRSVHDHVFINTFRVGRSLHPESRTPRNPLWKKHAPERTFGDVSSEDHNARLPTDTEHSICLLKWIDTEAHF